MTAPTPTKMTSNPLELILQVEDLSITLPEGRSLLRNTALRVARGEFVLLVGSSGTGKSTLLEFLADLRDLDENSLKVEGRVSIGANQSNTGNKGDRLAETSGPAVGLVFQNHALFDELSALSNVRFALDHRAGSADDATHAGKTGKGRRNTEEAAALLEHLNVPQRASLAHLSGGEQRRVAIARTLAMNPPILLFDEPTTGLDPARSRAVAKLIAGTCQEYGKTIIVVTHDYEPFLAYKPRLVLMRPETQTLDSIDEAELRSYFDRPVSDSDGIAEPPELDAQGVRSFQNFLNQWLITPGHALWTVLASFIVPWLGWRRTGWKLRYLWHYLRMVLVGTTVLYVAIAGAMLGFVFVTFSFANIPYAKVIVPLLTEEFLAGTGYSMYRVVVPLMIAVLMAGKCGAAAAADLGARRLTHQFEAMRNLGGTPEGYLHGNLALASAVAGPVLSLIAFVTAGYAALIAYLMARPEGTVALFRRNFFALLWPDDRLLPVGTGWFLIKSLLTGVLIAGLAYELGSRPKQSAVEVSRGVSHTIFWASLGVLLLHALFSFVEF